MPEGLIFGCMVRRSIDFPRFRTPNLLIFGIILGILETAKMYAFKFFLEIRRVNRFTKV